MHATANEVKADLADNGVRVDVLSRRGDEYTAKQSYYWGATKDSTVFANAVKAALEKDTRIKVEIVTHFNHFHAFVGSAKPGSAQDSYLMVRFKIVPNREMVTVINILSGKECQIQACDRGGPCDPSTERYHCM